MDRGAWGVLSVQSQRVGHEEQLTFSQAKIYHPGSTVVKNLPANARKHRRCGFDSWVGRDALQKQMATHSSILAWKIPRTENILWEY